MSIIKEEMRTRKKMCEFAKKYIVTMAAKRHKTNRHFVYRKLKKFDRTVQSLALKSRRPKSHPNQHTENEIESFKLTYKRYAHEGLAEVYVQLLKRNYKRCYSSMKRMILLHIKKKEPLKRKYKKYNQGPNKLKLIQENLFKWILNTFQNSVSSRIHIVSAIVRSPQLIPIVQNIF